MTQPKLVGPDTSIAMLHLTPPVSVGPEDHLGTVAARMTAAGTSLAVVTGGGPAVVTERDLVRALGEGMGPATPVSRVATHDPVQVGADTPLATAAQVMLRECVRHLLVVDGTGRPRGVISVREVLRTLMRTTGAERWADMVEGEAGA